VTKKVIMNQELVGGSANQLGPSLMIKAPLKKLLKIKKLDIKNLFL
jgi:hypothetical protein